MKTKLSTLILSKLTFSSLKLTFTLLMLAFTTLTLTFTACSNDDEDNILSEDEGKQLAHPAVVDFSAGITTRVTTSSEWEAGDLVGISASEIAGAVSTPKYTNIQYKADIFAKYALRKAGITRNVLIDKEGRIVKLTRLYNPEEFASLVKSLTRMEVTR